MPNTDQSNQANGQATSDKPLRVVRGHSGTVIRHLTTAARTVTWCLSHLNTTSKDWMTDAKIDEMLTEVKHVETALQGLRTSLENRKKVKPGTPSF